jgi:hypothetical protein
MGNAPARASSLVRTPVGSTPSRPELLAGLAFLEGSRDHHWGVAGLRDWFDEHLVKTGAMMPPVVVTELSAGTVALHGESSHGLASQSNLPRILIAARIRVLTGLRGLLATPADDRFVAAAIFTSRVRRLRVAGENRWVVRPEPTATLSGTVLSMFTVDVLSNREIYDRAFCLCDACDRVTFQYSERKRTSCPDHLPPSSGLMRKVTLDAGELEVTDAGEPESPF